MGGHGLEAKTKAQKDQIKEQENETKAQEDIHGYDISGTADMRLLVLDAPCSNEISHMPADVLDLRMIAHCRSGRRGEQWHATGFEATSP